MIKNKLSLNTQTHEICISNAENIEFSQKSKIRRLYTLVKGNYCVNYKSSTELLKIIYRTLDIFFDEIILGKKIHRVLQEQEEKKKLNDEANKQILKLKMLIDLNPEDRELFNNKLKKSLFKRSLYNFQALAVKSHLMNNAISFDFSVPGVGKTSIAYALYSLFLLEKSVTKMFVIGPLSSRMAWQDEFDACFLSKINLKTKKENYESELLMFRKNQKKVFFINYENISRYSDSIFKILSDNKVLLVIDEAHRIKNPDALRTKTCIPFFSAATKTILLTGTPMPNGYQDLYNYFKIINLISSSDIFSKNWNFQFLKKSVKGNHLLENKIKDRFSPYFFRITKKRVKLPIPVEKVFSIKMDSIQKEVYSMNFFS